MRRCLALGLGLSTLGLLLLGGCPRPPGGGDEGKAALRRFSSQDELLSYFKSQARAQSNRYTRGALGTLFDTLALAPAAGGAGAAEDGAGNSSGTPYSTTNLQEEGVDESDLFKSDGAHFYIARNRTLRIVRAAPNLGLAQVGALEFDAFIEALYLVGRDRLIALGQKYSYAGGGGPELMIWPPYHVGAATVVYSVNIADPAAPALVARNELDGCLVSSRITGSRLILVLAIAPELPANPTPRAIDALTLADILPRQRPAGAPAPLVPPENWYRPESPAGYCATAVLTLDAADITQTVGSVAIMANVGTLYASTAALYLTDPDWAVDGAFRTRTAVHKLRFNADGVAEYVASGTVPGRLLNQFSLGEFEGHLRLATHIPPAFTGGFGGDVAVSSRDATAQAVDSEVPRNAVFVLGESAGELAILGSVDGIAPNERLYAARFLGTRGYLVTFRQIDPLFVLDLSNPAAPAVVGELKVPGYSDYLHPLGANRLIGVGRTTITASWGGTLRNAIQLSLFDTTDPANPTLVQQLELGGYGSESDVSQTHKAFTFLPESGESGLLALPVQLWTGTAEPWLTDYMPNLLFEGIVCYRVTPSGFTELGRLPAVRSSQYPYWWNPWRRGAFIGDTVFAITPAGVAAAAVSDLSTTTSTELPAGAGDNTDEWYMGVYAGPLSSSGRPG